MAVASVALLVAAKLDRLAHMYLLVLATAAAAAVAAAAVAGVVGEAADVAVVHGEETTIALCVMLPSVDLTWDCSEMRAIKCQIKTIAPSPEF